MKYSRYLIAMLLVLAFMRAASAKEEKDYFDECMKNFNFEKVDLTSREMQSFTHHLNNYFACRVAANDDINECSNLLEPIECRRVLTNYWLFYGRLIMRGKITQPMIDACSSTAFAEKDKKGCEMLAEVITKNDPAICNSAKDSKSQRYCAAFASLNPSLCADNECRDKIFFLDALRKEDPKLCDRISSSAQRLRWICKGGASQDAKVCEKNADIEKFKKDYCTHAAKGYHIDKTLE